MMYQGTCTQVEAMLGVKAGTNKEWENIVLSEGEDEM
jgi:hypothetical protein